MTEDNARQKRDALLAAAVGGDRGARDEFAGLNLSLVWSVVKRFGGRGYESEDLFQVGCIGLIKSIEKFDFSFGVKFSTYAVPMILGEIKRYIRDDGMIKVSRGLKELTLRIKVRAQELMRELMREPTVSEIAQSLGIEEEDVVLAISSAQPHESIHAGIHTGDHSELTLEDTLRDQSDQEGEIIDRLQIREMLKKLTPREQTIIVMRYYKFKTQAEIAASLGISQVQVSRLEKKILQSLRSELSDGTEKGKPPPKGSLA